MKEKSIEFGCCRFAEKMGWLALKITSPQMVGVPDRLFIGYRGESVWVEFKTPTGKLSPMQERMIKDLDTRMQKVFVIRSLEEFKIAMGWKEA